MFSETRPGHFYLYAHDLLFLRMLSISWCFETSYIDSGLAYALVCCCPPSETGELRPNFLFKTSVPQHLYDYMGGEQRSHIGYVEGRGNLHNLYPGQALTGDKLQQLEYFVWQKSARLWSTRPWCIGRVKPGGAMHALVPVVLADIGVPVKVNNANSAVDTWKYTMRKYGIH
jgi:hypothetical protein